MSDTMETRPYLFKKSDWQNWITHVLFMSELEWKYFTPDDDKRKDPPVRLPEVVYPSLPRRPEVSTSGEDQSSSSTALSRLNTLMEFDRRLTEYRWDYEFAQYRQREYDRIAEEVDKYDRIKAYVDCYIRQTVSPSTRELLGEGKPIHESLKLLESMFEPTAENKKGFARTKYQTVMDEFSIKNLKAWVPRWQEAVDYGAFTQWETVMDGDWLRDLAAKMRSHGYMMASMDASYIEMEAERKKN